MKAFTTLYLGIALSATQPALAQDVCVDLANSIVFNQSRSFSFDEQREINRAELCTEAYKKDGSARSAKIEASYKFFSAGASGSENQIKEEQHKQCDAKFGDYWSKSISSNDARTASAESLGVVGECLRMNSSGMHPRMTLTSDGREFSLSLNWKPNLPADLRLDHAGPSDFEGYKCSAQSGPDRSFKSVKSSADVKTTVVTGASFVLSCVRPEYQTEVDGEQFTCYQETLLNIATNGPTATLKIPKSCTPSMPGRRASQIEQRLKLSEDRLVALMNMTNTLARKRPILETKELSAPPYKTEKLVLGASTDYFAWYLAGQSEYRHGANGGTTKCDVALAGDSWVLTAVGGDKNVGAEGTISAWCKAIGIRY